MKVQGCAPLLINTSTPVTTSAVYLIKRKGNLYSYYKNDFIMRDSYSRKYEELGNKSEYDLPESLRAKNILLSMSDTHNSNIKS